MDRRSFLRSALAAGAGWALAGFGAMAAAPNGSPPGLTPSYPWSWSVNLNVRAMSQSLLGFLPYLDVAAALGVQLVRFDAYWEDLEPEPDSWSDARLDWHVGLVQAARLRGIAVVINLCGYPRWALADLAVAPERFFAAWRRYVERVAGAMGDRVAFYQLGNEFNTVLDPIPAELDARVFRHAARALDDSGARYPWGSARTVINPFYGFGHLGSAWESALDAVLSAASWAIDVLALDYYPASYDFWNDPGQWSPLSSLASYARRYNKLLAVGETGCPSYLLGERRQADWYARALDGLAREVDTLGLDSRMTFVNLFELADRPPLELWEFWRPTEVTLGLSTRDLRPKEAFFELQRLISRGRPALPAPPSLSRAR